MRVSLRRAGALVFFLLILSDRAGALMAGSTSGNPHDTPVQRVDANLPNSPWAGVGSVRTPNGVYTATVIAPDYVLTAAHVVAGVPASEVRFALNADGDLSFGSIASAVIVHPGFASPLQPNANDLAVVHLANSVPNGVPNYSLATEAVTLGMTIVLVGYGASGDGAVGPSIGGNATTKRVGRNTVDSFGPRSKGDHQNTVLLYDFDGPSGTPNHLGGTSLGNNIETIVASGDSGGPCFVFEGGQWKLAAVSTFVMSVGHAGRVSTFGSIGGAVLVAPQRAWIQASMQSRKSAQSAPELSWNLVQVWRNVRSRFAFLGIVSGAVGHVGSALNRWFSI